MKKSGLGDSPFFLPPEKKIEAITPPSMKLLDQNEKRYKAWGEFRSTSQKHVFPSLPPKIRLK